MQWLNDKFVKIADFVSYAMGTPLNILFWLLLVAIWFILGVFFPNLFLTSNFLPNWFTSTAWNFPLNTITTLAELYIGFLVAAAANRSERRLHEIIENTEQHTEQIQAIEESEAKLLVTLQHDIEVVHKHLEEIKVRLGLLMTDDTFSVVDKT